jgi:hypothetical protein
MIISGSSWSTASLNPQARDVAESKADRNRDQRLLADLPRNGSGRATTRIHDVLRHSARLRPSLLCRFACIAQCFFCLIGARRGSILNCLLCLSGRCGGGSRGALHALAECPSGFCHARLQVSYISLW